MKLYAHKTSSHCKLSQNLICKYYVSLDIHMQEMANYKAVQYLNVKPRIYVVLSEEDEYKIVQYCHSVKPCLVVICQVSYWEKGTKNSLQNCHVPLFGLLSYVL